MKRLYYILLLSCVTEVHAQSIVQNCMGAIPICQTVYTQNISYSGAGSMVELNGSNQGCLTTGESNSVWYIFNTSTPGSLVFTISPLGAIPSDYDFAVWDLTDKSCNAIAAGLPPIRCNYASLANSTAGGLTGLSATAPNPSYGAGGGSFSSAINAVSGQTYVILINNSSASALGYTINFAGSTSQIVDNVAPFIKSDTIASSCSGPTSIKVLLSENIVCSSFAANGSDFQLTPPVTTIASASSVSCSTGGTYSNLFSIDFSAPLIPGNYTLSVVNGSDGNTLIDNCGNGMPVGSAINFTVYPSIQMTASTQFGCAGTPSGVITANGVGGAAPYEYKLNAAAYTSSNVFSGLFAGTYTITVKDIGGCTHDTVINLVQGASISIGSATVTNLTCYGINTGSVTVIASGGIPPLSYSVGVLPYSSNNTISNLAPGNHMVHVKDSYGCVKDTLIFISSPGQISFNTLNLVNATCGINNGSIQFTAFGGVSPLVFAINSNPYQATGIFTNLASGLYVVHIKDANNCIKDTTVSISMISSVSISSVSLTQPGCAGNSGIITVNGAGGTLPYQYSLNGAPYTTSNTFVSLTSGSYTVIIKDANGCTASSVSLLTSPSNLFFTNSSAVNPTCTVLGNITVNGVGGSAPYLFALGSGSYSVVNVFTPLVPGSYLIHIKDNNGCIHDTVIVLLTSPVPVINSLNTVSPSCSFPTVGSIAINASGGVPPLTFSLNGGAFLGSNSFVGLTGGVYTITVKDANGCTQTSLTTLTSVNTLMFLTFTSTNVGCNGAPLATISASAGNGNAPYQYSMNGGPFSVSGNYTGLNAGSYTIVAKDASDCTKSTVVVINSSATLYITSALPTGSPCFNPATGSIVLTGLASAPPIAYALNAGSWVSSGSFNNLAPGTYTVKIKDVNGCQLDSVVTVPGPPSMYFTNVVVVNTPCYGGIGSISLQGGGGVPAYSYSLNTGPFGSISNWPSLVSGSYTVHLKDANGCLRDTVIDLIQPTPITISSVLSVNASCSGAATGSISITVVNGTPPFTYALNAGAFSTVSSFTGLSAGVHSIHVKDANGCPKDTVITISNNGNFTITTITKVKPSCNGGSDGSITFSASGGTSPYQYALNSGAFGASNTFTGLAAGNYTLHAKDNAGCFKDSVVALTQPAVLGFSTIQILPVSCNNGANASVIATGNGGTPGYQYKIDGGIFGVSGNFINLTAGTHIISVKDAKGCIKDSLVSISQPPPLFFGTVSVTNPGCIGTIGVITLQGTGGIAPYTFAIGSGAYSAIATFTNLPPGNHLLHVKDNSGCMHDTLITLINNPLISLSSLTYTPFICTGGTNGFVSTFANSINPPVLYSNNGGPAMNLGYFSALTPGNYTIHVQDQAGCYVDTLVTIQAAPPIVITAVTFDTVLCNTSSDGGIILNAIGGLGTLRYAMDAGAYSFSNNFTNLTGGIYTMHVRDSLSCQRDSNVNLAAPPAIYFSSINLSHPHCSSATDGAITINATGGQAPYLYAINSSLFTTNNQFQNLFQGTYTVYIKDYNNCLHDTVIVLDATNYMDFANVLVNNVSCKFGNNGSISLAATGGFNPYQFTINTVSTGSFSLFTNLGAGTYTIQVTDMLGCQEDTVIQVSEPLFSVNAQIVNITPNLCRGDSIGTITGGGTGGTLPYSYSIDNSPFQSFPTFNGLLAGTYLISIKDANGCTGDTLAIVTEPDTSAQLFLVGLTDVSCIDVNDGTIKVTSKYGYSPVTYYLNGLPAGTDTLYKNLSPGNYIVEVQDGLGCKSTGKFTVKPSDRRPYIIIDSIEGILCAGDTDGAIKWHTINTFPPYHYMFDSVYIGIVNQMNGLTNGDYSIHVVDSIGCHADTTVSIIEGDRLDLDVIATPALCNGLGDDGKATAIMMGGQSPFVYSWSGSIGNSTDHAEYLWYGDHIAYVTDQLGCTDSAHFVIEYDPCCLVTLPNAFSPNGDGKNDIFRLIKYGYITLLTFDIYNRWGNQVFSSTAEGTGWDGKYHGEDCDLGTYYYLLRYRCHLKNETIMLKGDVTLIR